MKRGHNAVEGNIVQYVKELERRIAALERQEATVNELSELSGDLGDVTFGNGEGRLNGDGIEIKSATSSSDKNNIKYIDPSNSDLLAYLFSTYSATRANIGLVANGQLNRTEGQVSLSSYADAGGGLSPSAVLTILATATDQSVSISPKLIMGSTGALTGGVATIADEAATSFTPATPQGMMIFAPASGTGAVCGIMVYNTATPNSYFMGSTGGSETNVTTGALDGTTGTDGKFTVSCHTDGKVYLENRRGSSLTVRWQILAGTVS